MARFNFHEMPGEVHFTPKKLTLILKDENLQWLLTKVSKLCH